ncbi:cobalt ECF transporter T component CbiQ [Thermobispora bispora]|uniref:Cobalt ABC transporter, inner membrane subunit CbiQ n=1 Tax=Thermobispora bispora (strain ATCC 19993 / DSM 43833 / CBS 139.67 / JCM 10125 / KCTC 9307 / NBRC 14880 / R51) TaxID=469371 RepID=D6Y4W6_THEBD|nr:cobalt ECF transporter T component CbiQ [Thermobispora bispora]MBO2475187.1 cobalt ECF transporter T component CbiQ [Actinomycetales bacterium]MDI9581826.1 cobalt ECF transporter T component CbiQ [Thermobispora sp.]ADG87241.1 cobalt ABC transporter, inner membrane subunit CbiQ [Thermobispora bispora DSM 43833]MBX6166153.1 cobalt ECF transporter T component CbiQ [Thermobispora bispora]QSI47194.1 cobalt ECF transporter T component CbiQ [Thermobispora bispora]
MSAGHRLHLPGDTPVHRLPPQCKLAATLAFAVAVVATPRERFWAFGVYALLLAGVALAARVPAAFLLRRMTIEVPFVLFAVAIPIIGMGERVEVLGVPLSVEGLWASWNILAKATLGVAASILLAATTEPRMLLYGAERLRLPQLMVQIAMFMLRYLDVILDEMRRMRIARESRGFVARDLRQAPVLAKSLGALFIRAYERGERVHIAMLSRGYTGRMPVIDELPASGRQWAAAASVPVLAAVTAVLAWTLP